jgi:hypothetical protein
MSHAGVWGATVLTGALCLLTPLRASPITIVNDDFSTTTVLEDQTAVDTFTPGGAGGFTTVNGTNVDVIGNIGSVPNGYPDNLTFFEGICASAGLANCVDLDGTGENSQGQLESAALTLTAGTYSFSYDLIGPQGYMNSDLGLAYEVRSADTSTSIIFGDSACIAAPSLLNCIYYNPDLTLNNSDVTDGNITSLPLTVSSGVDYIEFVSNTPGATGALLTNVDLTETAQATPEPSTMLLVGAALLGLGGVKRLRSRQTSR